MVKQIQHPLPKHVAIIMDGNGRWAKRQQLPRVAGHKVGVETARDVIKMCGEKGIEVLTLFAFSSENWQRPASEVDYLMELFLTALQREIKKLHKNKVQLRFIGDREKFNPPLRACIESAEALTAANTGLKLVIAADYGGRWDIVQAAKQLAEQVAAGELRPDDITASCFDRYLCCADLPAPDLFIRSGGEWRISNFLIWQLAYTELYFTDVLWPDFNATTFDEALTFYAGRQRRFGYTSEQLQCEQHA